MAARVVAVAVGDEAVLERLGRGESLLRVLHQKHLQQLACGRRRLPSREVEPLAQVRFRSDLERRVVEEIALGALHDILHEAVHLGGGCTHAIKVKELLTCKHQEEDGADTPNVRRLLIARRTRQLARRRIACRQRLGRRVLERARRLDVCETRRVVDRRAAQAKVYHLERGRLVCRAVAEIVGLQVAVREAVRVAAEEAAKHLPQHDGGLVDGEAPTRLLEPLLEGATRAILLDKVERPRRPIVFVEAHDIWMIELHQRLDLGEHAVPHLLGGLVGNVVIVVVALNRDSFNRSGQVGATVDCTAHRAKAAAAERATKLIVLLELGVTTDAAHELATVHALRRSSTHEPALLLLGLAAREIGVVFGGAAGGDGSGGRAADEAAKGVPPGVLDGSEDGGHWVGRSSCKRQPTSRALAISCDGR